MNKKDQLLERAAMLVGSPATNISASTDIACEQWQEDYKYYLETYVCEKISFGDAIEKLKLGKKLAREGWNGKGIFLELQVPDAYSKMSNPYIYIDTTGLETSNKDAPKVRVPWTPSQTDLLSNDWIIID